VIELSFNIPASGRIDVGDVPDGSEAIILAGMIVSNCDNILHIARDDVRMAQVAEALSFFTPDTEVLTFPAWDCLPYDRVSPHRDILAHRVDVLTRLAEDSSPRAKKRIVVTTVAAILQKLPAPDFFTNASFVIACGGKMRQEQLVEFLVDKGYTRIATVAEAGEFAVRGGIVDFFPPGTQQPLRVDFFGDIIEDIRSFDALTQRSQEKIASFVLKPVSEVQLTPKAIENFRAAYRAAFGAGSNDDPLYEAISAGRQYPGMEHWAPLFGVTLIPLIGYLPGYVLSFDQHYERALEARQEIIRDFYEARTNVLRSRQHDNAPIYKPLPPEQLYLSAGDWHHAIKDIPSVFLLNFHLPDKERVFSIGAKPAANFATARTNPDVNLYDAVVQAIRVELSGNKKVVITAATQGAVERLGHLLAEHGLQNQNLAKDWPSIAVAGKKMVHRAVLGIERGFSIADICFITEYDILGDRLSRPTKKRSRTDAFFKELSSFQSGDYVVHADHGVGRYDGLEAIDVGGAPHDCLKIVYDGGDKLFVPVENFDVVSRYGDDTAIVQLDKLGGAAWQARKARVKQRIRDIANQLMRTAAQRALKTLEAITPAEGLYDEFCARFQYVETDDQQRAIQDVLSDLASEKPMDRLVCGDVGFGKTEVALRAAFAVALSGKQVAVVAPTTLLCRQHFKTFSERFAGFPVVVRQLSRLVTGKAATETKAGLAEGKVDIIVGTHALLAKSISFANLGLVIIDEEQHFGVAQKERLKELRGDVHVLTLTATPIPRTLQLSLTGIRDMSLIATPPIDRLAVRTFILPHDPVVVREAIMREHFRGGQIFYVCPRIEDLSPLAERLGKLVPEIKSVVAHGRMSATQLEAAMSAFYDGTYHMLLATNIIESGLDIPSANTMIVHRADLFGLAQLYQLRGRIGRSKVRGYCYLTSPEGKVLSETAERRLAVMQTLDQLGAGFMLASHDLDIRGAGNLLGDEQSGQVREVGVELYQQLLQDAVVEARGESKKQAKNEWTPQINLGMPVLIPEEYVADLGVRLGLYRRIALLESSADSESFAAEMIDRFGPLPEAFGNLLRIVTLKRLCRIANVEKLEVGPRGAILSFYQNIFPEPERLINFIRKNQSTVTLRPDHRLVFQGNWPEAQNRALEVERLLKRLSDLAAS